MIAEAGMAGGIVFLCAVGVLNLGICPPALLLIAAGITVMVGIIGSVISHARQNGIATAAAGMGMLLAACVVLREQSHPGTVLPETWLMPFAIARDAVESRITHLLPEPHAALLTGLLTGARTSMPPDFVDDLRVAGIIHIVAISGYNITLVLTMTDRVLRWIPRTSRRVLQVVSIGAFTLFVGADPPVVRAAIMGILGVAAIEGGRMPQIRRGMLWAAIIMLLFHPSQLTEDAGFQLSFLSLIGIVELSPMLQRFDAWIPEALSLRESTRTTIAAQCGTMPLIACVFGSIPLLAVPANVLVAPLVPLAMLSGSVALAADMIWSPAGQLAAYIAWAVLEGIVRVAEIVGAIPGAAITAVIPTFVAVLIYAAGGCLLLWRQRQHAGGASSSSTTDTHIRSSGDVLRPSAHGSALHAENGNHD